MVRVIKTADDLRALKARSARRQVNSVALELVGDAALRKRLEARINRHIASCGCGTGALFVVVGLVVVVTRSILTPASIDLGGIVRAVGFLLALGLVGKTIGLLSAKFRLRATISEIVHGALPHGKVTV